MTPLPFMKLENVCTENSNVHYPTHVVQSGDAAQWRHTCLLSTKSFISSPVLKSWEQTHETKRTNAKPLPVLQLVGGRHRGA